MRTGFRVALAGVWCALAAARCDCGGDPLNDVPGQLAVLACDERMNPAAGLAVEVRAPSGQLRRGTTGDDGAAWFVLPPDLYAVTIRGGGPDRTLPGVAVKANRAARAVDAQCVGPRQLPGRGAVAGDLCNQHLGLWVEGASVVVESGGERRETLSDSAGHFMVHNVPAGTARVSVRGPGPYVLTRYLDVLPQTVAWLTSAAQCKISPLDADCTDRDGDGYGGGRDCIAPDCNDADPAVFEGCLQQMPPVDSSPEGTGPAALPRIDVAPNPLDVPGLLAGGDPRSVPFTVRNLGDAVLGLGPPYLAAGPDDSRFLVSGVVRDLLPGESLELLLTAVPGEVPAVLQATLAVPSSDPSQPEVLVRLNANVGQPPGLSLSPPLCLREVALGEEALCQFDIHNDAARPLDITALGLGAATAPGFTVDPLPLPLAVPAGGNAVVGVRFVPRTLDTAQAELQVVSQLGQALAGTMRVVVTASPPTAVPDVLSVDGQEVAPGSVAQVLPLADVVLTARRSWAPLGRSIVRWQWDLISSPPESGARLLAPGSRETGFGFDSSGAVHPGLDVVGDFVIGLTVWDDSLQESARATLQLKTVPGQGIHLQLTWDHPYADMDLHLIRNAGEFNSLIDDCYYANCRLNSAGAPNLVWGTAEESPVLDVDDVDGYGPENVTLERPQPGTYHVGVFYFATHQGDVPVACTLKVFLGGLLLGSYTRTLAPARVLWRVADISVPSATITAVDTVETP